MTDNALKQRLNDITDLVLNPENFDSKKLISLSQKLTVDLQDGKRLAFIGNGGSAAESIHLAAEFTGKCVIDHRPLSVMSFAESQSALTSISNDYGPEYVFSRQIEAHLRPGDYLIAMSTSGNSLNILKAIEVALELDINVHLWTGSTKKYYEGVEIWNVQSSSTPRIQEIHLIWGHLIAELVEINILDNL